MGSYISIGMVLKASEKDFITKCKHIIEKYCNIILTVLKFPVDDNYDNWSEYAVNINDLYQTLDKCYHNKLAECIIDYNCINSYHIKGMIVKITHLINENTGILFEIPEVNFDIINVDQLEKVIHSILVDSLKIGFNYAFCDNECDIEYTIEEIVNGNIPYSILIYNNCGNICTKYAKWKIDGLTSRL